MSWVVTAVVVIGAGISAYGQYESGQAQKHAAEANADLADHEARQQLMISRVQEQIALQGAANDKMLADADRSAALQNATAKENEAAASVAQNEENVRRRREQNRLALSRQEQAYGSAGVVTTTGTPVAVLASQAAEMEGAVIDDTYLSNVDRQKTLYAASLDRFSANVKGNAAGVNLALAKQSSEVRGIGARISYRNTLSGSDIARKFGKAQARASTISATGTFVSSAAGAYGRGASGPKPTA